jgi:putative SOS response-associated peptidase YedK
MAAFASLTCEPNPLAAPIHPKAMPVIFHAEDEDLWLGGTYTEACASGPSSLTVNGDRAEPGTRGRSFGHTEGPS